MTEMPDAVVLCGGAGLRLKSVTGDSPKPMAGISGRPFLELLLRQLQRYGFHHVILAVGYQSEVIRSHFGARPFGISIDYAVESAPLGTGGALRNALACIRSDFVLIMNGDSYTDVDLCKFSDDFRSAKTDASMVVVPADGRSDCGLVSLGPDCRVSGIKEKQQSAGAHYVNAGIYLVLRHLLYDIRPGLKISLEEQVIPEWLGSGKSVRAFAFQGTCIDIGTPERYRIAQDALTNLEVSGTEQNADGIKQ